MTESTHENASEISSTILDFIRNELLAEELEVGPDVDLFSG